MNSDPGGREVKRVWHAERRCRGLKPGPLEEAPMAAEKRALRAGDVERVVYKEV